MASQNKVGDKFVGEDGVTSWEIISRENGKFQVRTVWGAAQITRVYDLSAQKINAMVNKGQLRRVPK